MDERSDEELMLAAGRGDESAFVAIYERHKGRVLGYARKLVRKDVDAYDIVQETFLYLFKKAPTWEPRAKLTTLIYKVVRSLAISADRKEKKHSGVPVDAVRLEDGEHGPDRQVEIEDEAGLVLECLGEMKDLHREVLHLRLVEDLPLAEIAEIVEIPVGTVKSRIHYGLGKLREAIAERRPVSRDEEDEE